ncbi:hypothetical protein SSX86_022657 [Deinandra increscens subsp. villosa]|uniref:DUF3741 domain-containing protein n=1 Tax=Deinandra increscens subsp. villosa TaxID=3103831 RepID=A0AAP0CR52_9ASTR
MTNSQKHACFSSLLRRVLCAGGLPTHPSSETDSPKEDESANKSSSPTATPPGIVARLMGLDSFPNSPKPTTMQKSRSLGSLHDFLITKPPLYHRRVVSFREVPTLDLGKSDMGLTPIQEKSNLKSEQVSSVPSKIRRKRRVNGGKKKVVDDGQKKCKSRNTRYNHPLPKKGKLEKKRSMLKRRESEEYCIKVFKEVCSLTRVEIEGGDWNWMDTKVVNNNLQQVSYVIGQQILHVLVYEMLDDLYM